MPRPPWDTYYMNLAVAVQARADCLHRKVGAILVKSHRVIATGYNGTPSGMKNCSDGGCVRCKDRASYGPGSGYDVCICVHAEQNTILSAARFGNAAEGSYLYTTMRPCFSCLKESLQAGIARVYYSDDFQYTAPELAEQYRELEKHFEKIHAVPMAGA